MTHPRPHEYPYPFNAWITQVLPLKDFAEAFIKSTREMRRANPNQWHETRKLQYGMLMDMVHGFSLPQDTAEQIWQSVDDRPEPSPYSTISSEQMGLEEVPSDRLQQLSAAAHHARSASFQHSYSQPQASIPYESSPTDTDSTPKAQFSPPRQEKLINQSKIAQQIEKQKQQAALREARTAVHSNARTSSPKPGNPKPVSPPPTQRAVQQPIEKPQPKPQIAPAPKAAKRTQVDSISENIAKLKAKKSAEQSKKPLYNPETKNNNLESYRYTVENDTFESYTDSELNSFSAQDNDDYQFQNRATAAPQVKQSKPINTGIKSRSTHAAKIQKGRQRPMPVAQPKSRKGLYFAIFLLICVNAVLIAYFVLPQFDIKNPLSFLTSKSGAASAEETIDLNSVLDEFTSKNSSSNTTAPEEKAPAPTPEEPKSLEDTAAELEAERAAIAARIEAESAAKEQAAAPQSVTAAPATQQPSQQESQQRQRQALNTLSKLRAQAADFNIEPETDADSALGYLQALNDLDPTPQMLIEAHRALEKGYLAMSKLAKAQGQDMDAQRMFNNSQNHASIADRYSQM